MSHSDQIDFIKLFKSFFLSQNFNKDVDVIDIGSLDVNGNIKNIFNFSKSYLGVDLIKGPNVDLVMNGKDINKIGKKFDIALSCECFEHANNWQKIFTEMCLITKNDGFVIITVASTGRIEHGTERSGNWQSPGNRDDYYKNLTKKDFLYQFNLSKIFSNYFFFYNVNSYDLYFVGIKGHTNKSNQLNDLKKEVYSYYKKKKIRKLLNFFYSMIMPEKMRQDIFFIKLKIKNKIKYFLNIN